MTSEKRLDSQGIAQMMDHLIQEELRIISAYNLLAARLHHSPAVQDIEDFQKHHTHMVNVLSDAVRQHGALPSRIPPPHPGKQRHLRLVAENQAQYLPELIWLETELLRDYEHARQLILADHVRGKILDPTIEAMKARLAQLKKMQLNLQH